MKLHKLHISEAGRRIYRHCFPERQVFLRSGGEVRFLRLSPRIQALAASGALVGVVWMAAVAYTAFHRDDAVISKERELSYVSRELDKLLVEMDRLQTDAITRARMLEERQSLLESAAGLTLSDATDIGLEDKAAPAESNDGETVKDAADEPPHTETSARVPSPESASTLLAGLVGSRQAQAGTSPVVTGFTTDTRAVLARLDDVAQRQTKAAKRLSLAHKSEIETGRQILADLRLPADDWLRDPARTATGGPYLPDGSPASLAGPFAELANDLDRMQQLQAIFSSLPAVSPAEKYYLSSRFGYRRDPLTKQRAHHSGIDLAGWRGEMIRSAATGKIVKAGRYPAYGNMVEIDHGSGIRTRYGHLRRITVKSGQIVDSGEQIGEMGSTGRSTGTHLHWEVWVNGKVVDPHPYLKAIKDVQDFKRRFAGVR